MSRSFRIDSKRILTAAAAFCLMLAGPVVHARGDAEAGAQKSQVCQACHGIDGNGVGVGSYPRLAGQYEDYLLKSLQDYKSGVRDNAIMAGFVANMSQQDMEDLAAFFASQEGALSDLSHYQ